MIIALWSLTQAFRERDGLIWGGRLAGVARLGQLGQQRAQLGPRLDAELPRQTVALDRRLGRAGRAPLERRGHQLAGQLEVQLDRLLRVLATRREAVGAAQDRHLDLDRRAGAQVAVDRGPVERPLVHEEAEHEVVARDRAEELAQPLARTQAPADA